MKEWVGLQRGLSFDEFDQRIVTRAVMLDRPAQHFALVPIVVAVTELARVKRIGERLLQINPITVEDAVRVGDRLAVTE